MENKKMRLGIGLVLSLFLLVSVVSAFGVTTFYWEGKELEISPGETKETYLLLQNLAGGRDMTLKAEVIEGGEIASLVEPDKTYFVPLGVSGIEVPIKLYVPEGANLGDIDIVRVTFKEVLEGEGGMVRMSGAVTSTFPVIVKSPSEITEEEPAVSSGFNSIGLLLILVLIVAGIIVVYVTLIKKKRQQ